MANDLNKGAERLTARILEDARAEADVSARAAQAEADRIKELAAAEAEKIRAGFAAQAEVTAKAAAPTPSLTRENSLSRQSAACWTMPSRAHWIS